MITEKELKIELLKDLIKDIEEQRCAQGCVPKSLNAPAKEARSYYKGMTSGVYLALRVINERIGRIKNDCNTNPDESTAQKVQPL